MMGLAADRACQTAPVDLPEVPTAQLRRVLELAHLVGRSEQRRSSGPQPPASAEVALRSERLSPQHFELVRAALDADDGYRSRVADLADEREVGETAWLWVARPSGWAERIAQLHRTASASELQAVIDRLQAQLAEITEQATIAQREVTSLTARLDTAEAALAIERQAVADMAELVEAAESDADARRQRAVELERRAVRAEAQLGAERAAHKDTRAELDRLTDPTPAKEVAEAIADARSTPAARRRRPYRSARGVLDDSPAGLDELVKVPGVRVLVDGYNVAKTRWPEGTLEWQRERLLSSMAAKFTGQASPDVVFDGADTYSSTLYSSAARRSKVRVTWSPAGVTADDVLLAMVDRIDPGVTVVVVSTDREVAEGAADRGANVVSSWSFANWLP